VHIFIIEKEDCDDCFKAKERQCSEELEVAADMLLSVDWIAACFSSWSHIKRKAKVLASSSRVAKAWCVLLAHPDSIPIERGSHLDFYSNYQCSRGYQLDVCVLIVLVSGLSTDSYLN
jgi:hypothetical protein